ncbi:RNA polymerase factor sigma-54 [Sulfuriroseicoccus oceanibius]|uniref:RNA polymerase factor sigma-54 n=1 Tax=Sulfuriroseicoccus oceanibius TaxID=2707525 RepID=A0A6B3L9D8_9BACT|nr:RNA polymerase factor sigma-54 [Sulfuriroseicoccus oceanibius]QQL46120.1 RNA polymerase factor sigma-54 [Sulfuriroseicoccus oceanibius]
MSLPPTHNYPTGSSRPAFGVSQHQEMGLQQRLSPQMRQSLDILQAPALELRQLVQQELEANPTLEDDTADTSLDAAEEQADERDDDLRELEQWDEDLREEQILSGQHIGRNREHEDLVDHLYDSISSPESLASHLQQQVAMTPLDPESREAFDLLVAALDERGYLTISLEDIALDNLLPLDAVETAYSTLLTLDPAGIGARDLADCLLIQLERRGYTGSIAAQMVEHHFDALTRNKRPEIAKALGVTVADVNTAVELIATLTPRPADSMNDQTARYIDPDLTILPDSKGEFQITLNDASMPRLRISRYYKDLIAEASTNQEARTFIREKIRSGKFIIQCIEQRQETLRRIAEQLVIHQQPYFEGGFSELRPLTMQQVADAIGVHETTVSRAINGKYAVTPHGIVELRRFFTAGFQSSQGEGVANTSVKERIAELVAAEDPAKPLSDAKISQLLEAEGLKVARRTIAKYRDALGIPPTNLRRQHG